VGRIGPALYFGLPGNPVAAMVTFLFFVRDALWALGGATARPIPRFEVRCAQPLSKRPGRTEYQRAILRTGADGLQEVALTGEQGAGMWRSMSEADCIIELAPEQTTVSAGQFVRVVPLFGLL
jgi:molybdopterin molybdotransferase